MNTVHRPRIRNIIRRVIFRLPERKYFTAGDGACREMMRTAHRRRRQQPDPEECSILAWARYELTKEMIDGFWEGNRYDGYRSAAGG